MDGLIEPSMPRMPSVVTPIPPREPVKVEDDNDVRRKSSFDTDKSEMIFNDKRRFSLGPVASKKPDELDKQVVKAMSQGTKVLLTAKQKKDIAEAFNAFDVEGIGYMSTVDLRVALRALGFEARKHDMKKILEIYDRGNTGRLCYSDFMSIIESKLGESDTKEDIIKAFKLFDKDHVGHVSFHNLRQVANELGEDINDEEVAEMIIEADLDDDGVLNQEEFLKILKKTSLY
ncbi:Centrin-1 [Orchesella cincta]|uniref:Centrin-1 n=1 Tax=Orchesella cincta TaxID=48709 RepID=A0A1D2MVG2_ORCCI|nr:Centrin-1 [Orchesella cincta]